MIHTKSKQLKALSSVEIILSLALFFVLVLGLSSAIFYGLSVKKQVGEDAKASLLLDEAAEALINIKDSSFSALTPGTWGLIQSSNQWALIPNQDQVDGYVRTIAISNIDDNDKQALITITWIASNGGSKSVTSTLRLTNWERIVSTGDPVDWSDPQFIGSYDLPDATSGYRIKIGSNNRAYTFKTGGQEDFQILDIENLTAITLLGNFKVDGSGEPYDMWLEGNYVYATSSAQAKEFHMIDVTDPANPSVRNYINLSGNADATGVTKKDNYVYVTRYDNGGDAEFHIIDVTDPDNLSQVGELDLGNNDILDVIVSGSYAYVPSSANNAELSIIDISNPLAPTFIAGLDLPDDTDASRITYYDGTVFLVQGNLVRIISVTNPTAPTLIATYNAGGAVGDLVTGFPQHAYLFLATANPSREFQVVDISNLASPFLYGEFDATAPLYGVDYDPINEIAGAVGAEGTGEFLTFSGHHDPAPPVDWTTPFYSGSTNLPDATGASKVKFGLNNLTYVIKTGGTQDSITVNVTDPQAVVVNSGFDADNSGTPTNVFVVGNTAYVTSGSNTRELVTMDFTNPAAPVMLDNIDLPGNANATDVFVVGNYAYVSRLNNSTGNEFAIVNISNPADLILVSQLNLASNNYNEIYVAGNYAYLASGANNGELTIVDISNPAAPMFVSALNIPTNTDATRITYFNNTVFLAQGSNLRIIDVTNPAAPALISTYATGGTVGDMTSAYPQHPYILLATAKSTGEFQIVDVNNLAAPTLLTQYNAAGTLLGVDYDPVNEIVVCVGNISAGEYLVFSGRDL
ncbi:MAG TPA: hypothetical protein PKU95_02375 [Candidatus Dojkabacteria bacterium]|nr:hypothetical protein [Candidatus Dojkabacteria bacterium]